MIINFSYCTQDRDFLRNRLESCFISNLLNSTNIFNKWQFFTQLLKLLFHDPSNSIHFIFLMFRLQNVHHNQSSTHSVRISHSFIHWFAHWSTSCFFYFMRDHIWSIATCMQIVNHGPARSLTLLSIARKWQSILLNETPENSMNVTSSFWFCFAFTVYIIPHISPEYFSFQGTNSFRSFRSI